MAGEISSAAVARVREVGFRAMCIKPVNAVLRRIVAPVADRLPWGFVHSIPLIGETTVDLPDGRELVLVADGYDSLASRMSWSGLDGFEPESLRLFLRLAAGATTVFDVGSHIGLYALLAAKGRPDVSAVAFEPVARNVGYLRGNIGRNGATNIEVVEAAVGAEPGTITLHVPETLRLPATASISERESRPGGDGVEVEVPVVALDAFVEERGIERVDLIKIDVEGAESDVLRGAAGIIRRHRPPIICEILNGVADGPAATEVFDGTDYRFFLITDDGLVEHDALDGDPTYYYKNYLLIPDELIAHRIDPDLILERA